MKKWLFSELQDISCDYCGANRFVRTFVRGDGMRVVECAECGLAFLNPRPNNKYISQFYEQDYFTGISLKNGFGGLSLHSDSETHSNKIELMPRAIVLIKKMFGSLNNLNIIEIGCASGDLLALLKNEGAKVKGVEISDFASECARKRGLDVETGTIENIVHKTKEAFDVIIALEVIEHVQSPLNFIRSIEKLIKPGGILLLSTPNYFCVNLYGKEWYGFNASYEHLYFFSMKSLDNIVSKFGLKIKYYETSFFLGSSKHTTNLISRQFDKLLFCFETVKRLDISDIVKLKHFKFGHTMTVLITKDNASQTI